MSNYFILFVGLILGQLFTTVISVYIIQYHKPIDYKTAFIAFVRGELAAYIVALVALLLVMFLLPDYISPEREGETATDWKWKITIMKNFRLFSLIFGSFAPLISLVIWKRGIKEVKKENDKLDSQG